MKLSIKTLILMALMLAAAALGAIMRPTISLADERPPIDLKAMVPTAFGDWTELLNATSQVIDPQRKQELEKLYSQTLTRTYVNSQGYRIMLSIAYGKNQSDALSVHKPEICYPAQGFTLLDTQRGFVTLMGKPIVATRLATNLGPRFEPITYWIVVGDQVVSGLSDKKWVELRYALRKQIPDGMLFRVSSIDTDTTTAYAIQAAFATSLVEAIPTATRSRFAGDLGQALQRMNTPAQ